MEDIFVVSHIIAYVKGRMKAYGESIFTEVPQQKVKETSDTAALPQKPSDESREAALKKSTSKEEPLYAAKGLFDQQTLKV